MGPQSRPRRAREGVEPGPRDEPHDGAEQPSAGRLGRHDRTAAGFARSHTDCATVHRSRSGGAGADVGPDDGRSASVALVSASLTAGSAREGLRPREHVRAIESAKKPETRSRRIEAAVANLRDPESTTG